MKKNDLRIIIAGLLIAISVYGGLQINNRLTEQDNKEVEIFQDGELEATYPLELDGTYRFESELGYNVVQILGGEARIIEASCPTLSCIEDGSIDHVNESVVCLPNHFHITISGVGEVEIDAISQ